MIKKLKQLQVMFMMSTFLLLLSEISFLPNNAYFGE